MALWPRYPTLYEINTWVWLAELGKWYGKPIDLNSVPAAEWDALATYGFDAVWFMGVWERSPAGIAIANQNTALLDDFRRALPDFQASDNVGSSILRSCLYCRPALRRHRRVLQPPEKSWPAAA